MQWDKAKNFMLAFFVIANILLAALTYYETGSHTLSRERMDAIQTVFVHNNIEMYYQIPRSFAPLRPIRVAGHDYNIENLISIFFPAYADVHKSGDANREVFTYENLSMVISNGYIVFDSGVSHIGTPNKEAAISLTQDFINKHYSDFRLDLQSTRIVNRGLRLFYRQEYQGHLIHTNFVEFLVTGEDDDLFIEQVDIQYGRPMGFAYQPRELIGPDEALLTFVQNIRLINNEHIFITYMDLAYFQTTSGLRETYMPIYAEPFYRIFIEGLDEPFRIHAYTNRMQ